MADIYQKFPGAVLRVQAPIFRDYSGIFGVSVENNIVRGNRHWHNCTSGSPAQLSRLLKVLRYVLKTQRGPARKVFIDKLFRSFEKWKDCRQLG